MDWLQQMRALNGILPGGDLVLVQKLSFRPGRGDTRASIRIEGYARSRTEVEDLGDLLQKRGYQVVPPTIESSSRDQDYASFFAIDATVPLPKKEKA